MMLETGDDINNYMTSIEVLYPSFKFLGVYPCNFYTDKHKVRKIYDLVFIYHKLAMIINTGREYTLGEHWVCLCFDTCKQEIYYYDSGGNPPTHCIQIYINSLLNGDFSDYQFRYNTIVSQTNGSDCGVYTTEYIKQWLN